MTPLRQHGVLDWAGWAGPTRLPLKGASGSIGHFLPGCPIQIKTSAHPQ